MKTEECPEQFTNTRKADFSSIYSQPDPRAYFRALGPLQYQIPQHALPFVEEVLKLSASSGTTVGDNANEEFKRRKVLDVCCSYGINAALLRCDVDLDCLSQHYESSSELSVQEQFASDKQFFALKLCRPAVEVLGLDVAPEAIKYAVRTGLLKNGWAENLEISDPSLHLREGLKDTEVIVCTGGVGYVGMRTFSRILAAVDHPSRVWMVTFVLRVFSFDEIATALKERYGLVTENVQGRSFRQRRFTCWDEQHAAVEDVRARGLETAGMEEDGWFYAECYVTRPGDVAGQLPEFNQL